MTSDARLAALSERIEQLSEAPEEVRSRFAEVLKPVLRLFGWEPQFKTKALLDLLSALQMEYKPPKEKAPKNQSDKKKGQSLEKYCEEALSELEENIESAERACVVKGYVPTARAAWLRRVYELCARAIWAAGHPKDQIQNRFVFSIDSSVLLPPLAQASKSSNSQQAGAADAKASAEMSPEDERLFEIHLAAVDHLLDSARGETEVLGHKRELLEGARRLLLDAAAAFSLENSGVEARRAYIAEQIVHINRLCAAGLSPSIALTHQAKTALGRGDRRLLMLAVNELDRMALQNGDNVQAALAYRTVRALKRSPKLRGKFSKQEEIEQSAREIFGDGILKHLREGYEGARLDLKDSLKKANAEEAEDLKLVQRYFIPQSEEATMAAALAVDGCFDVGGSLSPVRAVDLEERARLVSYPTEELVLVPARDIHDLPQAVIDDPRRIFLSLAEGRLLTRKYVLRESVGRPRTKLVGEVRIYLLDGSDSMLEGGEGMSAGARARVRDAILLAELATLQQRLSVHRRSVRVVLFYRYFTKLLWPLVKVDSIESASKSMIEVIRTPRRGGTNIEGALLSSFELLRKAKEEDPDLARAQIVLVTDGNAIVREDMIQAERERSKDVPLSVSVIALGEENASLRALVARQRQRGERAFYHFIDDRALSEIAEGKAFKNASFFLEEKRALDSKKTKQDLIAELSRDVGDLVNELDGLSQRRHALTIEMAELGEQSNLEALQEVGLSAGHLRSEGQKAKREAISRDRIALEKRFSNWFPMIPDDAKNTIDAGLPAPGTAGRADADSVLIALATIADVISEFGGTPLSKQADAIELLERLLPDARLSPSRYLTVLKNYPVELKSALSAVHEAAGVKSKVQRRLL